MGSLTGLLRAARRSWQSLRFRLWARRLDFRLRRNGSRLHLDAPHGAQFYALPHVEIYLLGGDGGAGSVTLRIGRDVKLGRGLTLDIWAGGTNVLELGDRATFQSWCRVQMHDGRIAIDSDVHVRDYVLIKSKGELSVGEWSILSRDVIVHATERISIADRVGIAERSTIIDSEHVHDGSSDFFLDNPVRTEPIVIESNVLLHANAMVLGGATIRRNVVVGAGALMTPGEYPSGWLYLGVPAKPFRELSAPPTRGRETSLRGGRSSGPSSGGDASPSAGTA
jgi:acetyltransferase-like isoleucine patch superfamily enzyme